MTLASTDFPAYFQAVHGRTPFPWQSRLVAQVLDQGWPDVLAVPTGCGKTSVLDVALFALAVQPERFARRIVMVIDRRVVVDQGYDHAKRIGAALSLSKDAAALQVAERLRSLWGGQPGQNAIEAVVLRGGMPHDDDWVQRPDRPVIAVSTVDQVGSRLLFRGYGVSEKMSSVHAGLLGHDTLFLLDEVHLATPFAETLLALRSRWRGFWPNDLPDRWGVVRMSATPGLRFPADSIFALVQDGEDDHHPRLKARLQARKPASLRLAKTKGGDEDAKRSALVHECVKAAQEMVLSGAGATRAIGTVAVIVNRVATARETAARLEQAAEGSFDVQLLTGRMRPLDRDRVLLELLPRIQAGRDRGTVVRPLVVVATQCIEAGADFDFDALVTECASLDALRQRFGRLDRLGERESGGMVSPAVILARSDQLGPKSDPDPIYGTALNATWTWIESLGEILDFGVRRLPEPPDDLLSSLTAPKPHAPILLPAHLDAWNQTHPRPEPDPEVALWLHGPQRGEPELLLVWRVDVTEAALGETQTEGDSGRAARDNLIAALAACPPVASEALTLPISAVRRWLRAQTPPELADTDALRDDTEERDPPVSRLVLRWNGDDSRVIGADDLRPGMTLVVPAAYGGIARDNWSPDATDTVADLGDLAQWQRHKRATLRLDARVLPPMLQMQPMPRQSAEDEAQDVRLRVHEWLEGLSTALASPWKEIVTQLRHAMRIVALRDGRLTLIARKAVAETVSTEDDGASFIERKVTLADHSEQVWRWADAFSRRLGLPRKMHEDLVFAAWLHDAGKADPRFQKWLVGGSAIRLASLDEPLAKSAQTQRDRRANWQARAQAGYPEGYRHEILSVALVAGHPTLLDQAHDRELVLHLVGSHHGWCRPFAPFADHEEDIETRVMMTRGPQGAQAEMQAGTRHQLARLDAGIPDRFWALTERYGWWGLAWLEALLRLADHRASAEGMEADHG